MSEYYPHNWVVLKLKAGKGAFPVYKVLAGWSGGYTTGDSWRMNSGISKVTKEDEYFKFWGESGSCYVCHKDSYRLTMANSGVYNKLKEQQEFDGQVQLMPEDTDWMMEPLNAKPPHSLFWWMSPRRDENYQWWWGYLKVYMRRLPEAEKQKYIDSMKGIKNED